MRRLRRVLPLILALFTGACRNGPAAAPDGKAYFAALNCKVCHVIGGEGGRGGPDLTYVGFRRNREWLDVFLKDPQAWKKDTLMPDPRLSPKARAALVDYLMTLKGQDYAGQAPWEKPNLSPVERGHVLFAVAGCIACHGKGGSGGYPNNNVPGGQIPALQNLSEKFTREELKAKIRRGVKPAKEDPAGPDPLVAMPAWGEVLKEGEIESVMDYLLSLKSGQDKKAAW